MAKIWDIEETKATRRQGTFESKVSFSINGSVHETDKKVINGEMESIELVRPVGEMMTTADGRKELMKKVVLDVELGREQVPVLYSPIYDRIQDPNFPKEFEAKWAQYGSVIFFEHLEGSEVRFGSLQAEQGPIARIKGFAAGFEYTKEMEIFNQMFNFELLNRSFGEAHNAILNHMHLGPIIAHTYKAANKTTVVLVDHTGRNATAASESHYILSLRATIRKGLVDSRTNKRPATIILAHSANKEDIQEAIGSLNVAGSPYRALEGITDVIYYDGWNTQVGKKEYAYPGAPLDKIYLIRPKRGFKELVKQELQINSTMGDASRLVESQVIGDFWRGVFAAVDENVQEVTLPANS